MKISMPHMTAKSGAVDLIGNPVKFSKTPVSYRHSPPICGEHTDEITAELLTNLLAEKSKTE
jgi:crotonobetainyl-CoA:carnitine CoA-transferase CaiB-like acyl-CoA transferase